jgi:ATP-dependent Lon protease
MPETAQLTLPVLPLHNGVVFPHMVVTVRVETDEGRTAFEAADQSDGRIPVSRVVTPASERLPTSSSPTTTATSSCQG